MSARLNIVGKKFGKLTVVKLAYVKDKASFWDCICDCGKQKVVKGSELTANRVKSCGCLQKETLIERNKKHGLTKTRLYSIYCGIKSRCFNSNQKSYKNYGGRNITICDEWLADFMNFYNWAVSSGYKRNLTIDRKDNNGNYNPLNCHWVNYAEQAQNRREHKLNPRNKKGQFTKIEV